MSEWKLRAPKTVEEMIKDLNDWSKHTTRYPDQKQYGGITISQELMRDICTRILVLEKAAL